MQASTERFLSLRQASWRFPRHAGGRRDDKGEGSAYLSSRYRGWTKPQVMQRFSSPWVNRRPGANPDFLLRGPHQRPRVRLSVKKAAGSSPTPPTSTGNRVAQGPAVSFPVRTQTLIRATRRSSMHSLQSALPDLFSAVIEPGETSYSSESHRRNE
jgi:hypothetical protein